MRRADGAGRNRPIFLLAALVPLAAVLGTGCRSEPVGQVTAREGYIQYCASCHGVGGKGDGPLAGSLSRTPTDLTALAKTRGRFDEAAVLATIDGRRQVAAHGPREMPVWGALFQDQLDQDGKRYPRYTALLSASALVEHLRSIQEE